MIYADFDYYQNEYFGKSISADDYSRLATRASQYIDYITMGKAKVVSAGLDGCDIMTALKTACCALAEQYQLIESAQSLANQSLAAGISGSGEVQSETVGSWSRSYRSGGDSAASAATVRDAAQADLASTARQYLAHTGLLYRGGGCCR